MTTRASAILNRYKMTVDRRATLIELHLWILSDAVITLDAMLSNIIVVMCNSVGILEYNR
jgi:hypothetical protein